MNQLQHQTFICRCLSPFTQLQDLEALRALIRSDSVVWNEVVQTASEHLVTAALFCALERKGLLPLLPEELREYLSAVHELNRQRNRRLHEQLRNLLSLLNDIGIQPVLLKGAAGLFDDLYLDPAERMMGDLDLLIREADMHRAVKQMFAEGYRYCETEEVLPSPLPTDAEENPITTMKSRGMGFMHHIFAVFHPNEAASVELHLHPLLHLKRAALLDTALFWRDSTLMSKNGLEARLPSLEHRIVHNFLHVQIQDGHAWYADLRLRQLYEFVQICDRYRDRIKWDAVLKQIDGIGFRHSFRAYLLSAQGLFQLPIPAGISTTIIANVLDRRRQLQYRYAWFGKLNKFVIYYCLRLARELSPIRVRLKYDTLPLTVGYWQQIREVSSRLLQKFYKQMIG